MTTIASDAHPLLMASAFTTTLPTALGEMVTPADVLALLRPDAAAPLQRSDDVRAAIRDLLRVGGYKPTGRGKPASEYLVRASEEGALGPINPVVDVCNAVSLNSGLPISVVDLDRAAAPFRIGIADAGASYVFNAGGQEIDVSGLLCLFDAAGPCANAVKDSQRTKTTPETRRTLSVIWGTSGHEDRLAQAVSWYRALLTGAGAATEDVTIQPA
jgi:DNA/RNA-binding domain of Phe-tRNA-synthetase-like protein